MSVHPLHRWEYGHLSEPQPSGADAGSYALAAAWLDHFYEDFRESVVEDWGCGSTYAKRFFVKARYQGIDGSPSPFPHEVRDLRERATINHYCDGILIRHVLEHIEEWPLVWRNALLAATHRICLVLRVPLAETAQRLLAVGGNGAPEYSLYLWDIVAPMHRAGFTGIWQTFASQTEYGQETIFYCERRLPRTTIGPLGRSQ